MINSADNVLHNPKLDKLQLVDLSDTNLESLSKFAKSFPLRDNSTYEKLFTVFNESIDIRKPLVATNNLKRIFEAVFHISASSGFNRMTLRDLSKESGLSLGVIYSCINKKEDIVNMVGTVVELSTRMSAQFGQLYECPRERIEKVILFHLYSSAVLQPWYFFLYFETRNLSKDGQLRSKEIESATGRFFESAFIQGVEQGMWKCEDPKMASYITVTMLEDWYLKPWKYQAGADKNARIARYHKKLTDFVFSAIA